MMKKSRRKMLYRRREGMVIERPKPQNPPQRQGNREILRQSPVRLNPPLQHRSEGLVACVARAPLPNAG